MHLAYGTDKKGDTNLEIAMKDRRARTIVDGQEPLSPDFLSDVADIVREFVRDVEYDLLKIKKAASSSRRMGLELSHANEEAATKLAKDILKFIIPLCFCMTLEGRYNWKVYGYRLYQRQCRQARRIFDVLHSKYPDCEKIDDIVFLLSKADGVLEQIVARRRHMLRTLQST